MQNCVLDCIADSISYRRNNVSSKWWREGKGSGRRERGNTGCLHHTSTKTNIHEHVDGWAITGVLSIMPPPSRDLTCLPAVPHLPVYRTATSPNSISIPSSPTPCLFILVSPPQHHLASAELQHLPHPTVCLLIPHLYKVQSHPRV